MRVAVLGCGFGAQHLDWLARHPELELDTLCYFRDHQRAADLAGRYGIGHLSTDPVAALRERGIELAVIVTPPDTRQPLVAAALEAGAFVFVDKPLATTPAAAAELVDLASIAPQRCAVNFQWRGHPAVRELRDQLAGGIGTLLRVQASFFHDFFLSTGEPSAGEPVGESPASWRQRPDQAGAGTLGDQGVHLFDLLHWLIPRNWTAVAAHTSTVRQDLDPPVLEPAGARTEDLAEVWLREPESGCLAGVSLSRLTRGVRAIEVQIEGSQRCLQLHLEADDASAELTVHSRDATSKTARYGPTSLDPYPQVLAAIAGRPDPDRVLASFPDGLWAQQRLAEAVALASSRTD
ncbi:Gfo/Idh/MocA family protein [Jatrophihabitans sp.]|uniref:Gfo/Idh/MocA family protein n=1 Tax=Jatrophihabitans sp. TaxID=1932789 RepID=UPI002CE42AF2|nr:Gfo/Idh/MocA family oxidoreductase [Jatrophihabitans sp.]